VRAITAGRVLVVDEADKAPLEVVAVLRSLLSEGRMLLADGRRVVPSGTEPREGLLPIAAGFRAIVLANKPGFPFLGNDFFRECGDVLSCHTVENPDLASELKLLRKYAPSVADSVLGRVAGLFAELRTMATDGRLAYPYSTREAVALVRHMERYPSDGLLGAAENVFAFDAPQPQIASQIAGVLRRHGIPAAVGSEPFAVELAPETALPVSEVAERWVPSVGAVQRAAAEQVPVGQWAARKATFQLSRDEAPAPTASLQLGRMRVFTEEVRRWRLPPGLQCSAVAALTAGTDGTVHVLTTSFSGLHLFSYSPDGRRVAHVALGGRRFSAVGLGASSAAAAQGVSLHALPAAVGGGLLLHQPGALPGRQLLWLTPGSDGDGADGASFSSSSSSSSRSAARSVIPAAAPSPLLAPNLADAPSVLVRTLALPPAFVSSVEEATEPSPARTAVGFLNPFSRASSASGASDETPTESPSVLVGAVPGEAERLHFVSITPTGELNLGRLWMRVTPPPPPPPPPAPPPAAAAQARDDLGSGGGAAAADAEVPATSTATAPVPPPSEQPATVLLQQAMMAMPTGLHAPLSLRALSADSCLLLGSDGMHAAIVQWEAPPPSSSNSAVPVRLLPVRREAVGSEAALESVEFASILTGGSLGLSGGSAHFGTSLESAPLIKGEAAFAFRHRRPAAQPPPTASGFSPAPDKTPSASVPSLPPSLPPSLAAEHVPRPNEGEGVGGAAGGEAGVGGVPPSEDPLAPVRFFSMVSQIRQGDGGLGRASVPAGAPLPEGDWPPLAGPALSPVLLHAIPAAADEPPALQLVDLAAGTLRQLPLLPAPPSSEEGEETPEETPKPTGGFGGGWGAGTNASLQQMEVAMLAPVPAAAGGGAVTLHRNGELVLWQVATPSLANGLADWRAIVGWKGAPGGEGGPGGGGGLTLDAKNLSIIQNFPSPKAATAPKHGKVDETGAPHVGGNTWAGGTGGRDTAGLGGKGGPYRLSDGNPIHQISDAEKANVSPEALKAAREMALEAYRERLKEIDMSEHEASMYESLSKPIRKEVDQLRVLLQAREARSTERVWLHRQSHGELDESRLVDGIAGERAVYRRRAEQPPEQGAPQLKPKLLRFVLDLSGSMYYFNGHDRRLERCLQTAVLLFEAFEGFEHRYRYSLVGHSGDTEALPLVEYGAPPANEKERLKLIQRMAVHTQFCNSGDHTLEATYAAIDEVASRLPEADEAFVFLLSDANLERYGVRPQQLATALTSNHKVHAHAIFLSSLGGAAERLQASLPPGRGSICLDAADLPKAFRNAFSSSVLRDA